MLLNKIMSCSFIYTFGLFLVCGKRYKNGPGLKYHYAHYNHDQEQDVSSESGEMNTQSTLQIPSLPFDMIPQLPPDPVPEPVKEPESVITPNDYCDFCLGDVNQNKKTFLSEELLSCADCGRSG